MLPVRGYRGGAVELPTAIIASSDQMAIATLEVARQQGLEVPRDLALISFDDTPIVRFTHPPERPDPREADPLAGEKLGNQRISRVRRREDHPVGPERRDRAAHLALDMVAVRVDQLDEEAIAMLGAVAVAALGLTAMGLADSWTLAATGFGVYAAGSAVFLALHATFSMQLLPDPRHRGRDLGLQNLTNTLPALLGPLLAWLLATPEAFGTLMFVLAALMLCGGLAILMVRGRR
jgi:hypothetical protein